MDFKDYYAVLGLARTASTKEVKQTFRRLARTCHPDVNPGDKKSEARFKDVNEAHEVLGNPASRRKYDELGANWRQYEHAQRGTSGPPRSRPWAGGRNMTPEEMENLFGGQATFSDLFGTFFAGGSGTGAHTRAERGEPPRRSRRGRDIHYDLDMTLEDAFRGLTRRLTLPAPSGTRTVDVRIPSGVQDGSRIRVTGEGEAVSKGTFGNLFLRVRIAPHPDFELRNRDVFVKLRLPVTTAVLGGEAAVPTVSGNAVRLRIPPLTQSNQLFRLKGYGMPVPGKTSEHSDAYARIEIQLPSILSPAAREHWEQLAALES
jgi:curved DNA-binding protein